MLNQKEEGSHFACKKGKKTVNSIGIVECWVFTAHYSIIPLFQHRL
jgi:hypothetical protein